VQKLFKITVRPKRGGGAVPEYATDSTNAQFLVVVAKQLCRRREASNASLIMMVAIRACLALPLVDILA